MKKYDVIISGTGIAGTTYGTLLAKFGLEVLLIESGRHPRFALGEAMLPQSAIWPFILGEYFGVPEIQNLSHADRIVDHVTPACGVKHSIGFVYHDAKAVNCADQMHQLIPPHLPFYSESHLLRAEVDHYLLRTAQAYGCDYIDGTKIEQVDIRTDRVRVQTSAGEFFGAYYIDASGRSSKLAQAQDLRLGAPEARTQSRTIYTHVEGLVPFDDILDDATSPGQTRKLHEGTLHHVFDGGWIWVIPFDNFHRSTSSVASIGLMLDPRKYPREDDVSAEEEFFTVIRKYPQIQSHLGSIRPIMDFMRSGCLQYCAKSSVGHRYFLTNQTYGFIDALYSNGLVHTFESAFRGTSLLLSAFGKIRGANTPQDFSREAFAPMDALHVAQWEQADFMVSNAYRAMRSFATWNAWTQLWLAQVLFHDIWLQRACFHYFSSREPADFEGFLREVRPGMAAPFATEKNELFDRIETSLAAMEAAHISSDEAAASMLQALQEQEWLPKHVYAWGDPAARHVDFARPEKVGALLQWGAQNSPPHIREGLFDFQLPPM